MVCIWEKFRTAIHKDVPLKIIWDHLESMYDLVALVSNIKNLEAETVISIYLNNFIFSKNNFLI